MEITPPIKEVTVFGYHRPLKSLEDFWYVVAKQGQPFGVNWHPIVKRAAGYVGAGVAGSILGNRLLGE